MLLTLFKTALHLSVSLGFFLPALHVPLGACVDVAVCWGGTLGTVVPAPGATRPTVMD